MEPSLGTIVSIPQGRGVVRFVGTTSFQAGKWFGVELDEPNGKNDGSVQGVRYFNCRPGYGVFVRQTLIKGIHGSELESRPTPSARSTAGRERSPSSSSLLRASTLSRQNSGTAASGSSASSRSQSPAKPTPLQISVSASALSRGASRPPPSPTKRQPTLPTPPTPSLSVSTARKPFGLLRQPSGEGPQPEVRTPTTARPSSPLTQPPVSASPPSISAQLASIRPPSRSSSPNPQDAHELQELRAKIRVLEARRTDDARHIRELETRLADAESFVAIRPKLQAKLNAQQTELIATKRELADAQQLASLAESRIADAQDQLELVMLDKEVAEERAEIAEATVEELKEKLAMMKVENDVLKDEDGSEASPAKDSLAYIQLEKQNERLKEALIRLRDLSHETEQEQRRRIAEMEKDVATLDELQVQYEEALIKLSNAETEIEGLKLQIDDALGAEDLLVQLTDRNLELGEKIEEMRITIEELQMLQEVNDEIDEMHQENEKKLNQDIEDRDMQIQALNQKIAALDEACQDYEGTISQFRELVGHLQSELDQLRNQTQTAQTESATAASQTAAMMSLNLKLQSSAVKSQAKTIELELKKQEAKEKQELLDIIQPYLPQLYVDTDTAATHCYLLFQRLACKADLINMIVAQAYNLPEALNGTVTEGLVGVCEMRGRISSLATVCKRFSASLRRSDVDTFLDIGRLYPEWVPLEKRLDKHLDALTRDAFKENECVNDVVGIQNQIQHLPDTYFSAFDYDLAERELGWAWALDHDLDTYAASLVLTKTSIEAILKDEDCVLEMGGQDIDQVLFQPLEKVLGQCKSAKGVARKLIKRLEHLSGESMAVKVDLVPQLRGLIDHVSALYDFGIQLAQGVMPHLSDVRGGKSAFQLANVLSIVKQTAMATAAKDLKPGDSFWDAISQRVSQLVEEGHKLVPLTMESDNVQKITGTAPWIVRVAEIKAALAVNVEAERKLAQLNEEMQGLARTIRTKDQAIQESSVKIELMERRMEAAKKQADALVDLENELAKMKKQERSYEEAIEQLQTDLDTAEQENAKLKVAIAGQEQKSGFNSTSILDRIGTDRAIYFDAASPATGTQPVDQPDSVPVEGSLETSYLLEQIDALRGTVKFLRSENNFLKGQDLIREIEALSPLPIPSARRPGLRPLDPPTTSDTSESESDETSPGTVPSLRSLATETKLLYRDVIRFSSSPKVVDLSELNRRRAETKSTKVWMPKKKMPAQQVLERKLEAGRLSRRVQGLLERASLIDSL